MAIGPMIVEPEKAKLIIGILASNKDALTTAHSIITKEFGIIDNESIPIPFTFTQYYNDEMGDKIIRQFVSVDRLISPAEISMIKCRTIELENAVRINGKRIINLDPGYLTLHSLILVSTKQACYRVYLDKGIYGQAMLHFKKGDFVPFEYTYPDYADEISRKFFTEVREIFFSKMKIHKKENVEK